MIETAYSLGIGFLVGLALAVVGVPVPAPSSIAGVAGILGLTLGYIVLHGFHA